MKLVCLFAWGRFLFFRRAAGFFGKSEKLKGNF
jgi:hypothetical protein